MKAKVITLYNNKGGVGKTTTTQNLRVALAENNKKVLLIDNNSQGNLAISFGIQPEPADTTTAELYTAALINKSNLLELPAKEAIIQTKENVDIIPTRENLADIKEQLYKETPAPKDLLKKILSPLKQDYDYILIDCAPVLELLEDNALTAADSVIIPVQSEPYASHGMNRVFNKIKGIRSTTNRTLKIDGILYTLTDERTRLSRSIRAVIEENYGQHYRFLRPISPEM